MDYIRSFTQRISDAFSWTVADHDNHDNGHIDVSFQDDGQSSSVTSTSTSIPSPATVSRTSRDIIRTALLLREKLSADIVPLILDYAQLWDLTAVASSSIADSISEMHAGKLQTALIVPHYLPRGAVRRIRFRTISKDQGWSSYPQDQGTYRGSCTWFEAGVRGLLTEGVAAEGQDVLNQPISCQHLRTQLSDHGHRQHCVANPSLYKYGSKRIVTNVHAGRDWKTHVVEWDGEDEDEDIRKTVRELQGGDRIEVSAHARYPGWRNEVRIVVIELESAVVRKM